MKSIKFLLTGILFGIVMTKSEAISWYRIQEMFRFQSFHMYGMMGTALILGIIAVYVIKKFGMKDAAGNVITFQPKEKSVIRYLAGGTIFGLGWALTGACPGPMFVSLGYGFAVFIVIITGGLLGTLTYGATKNKLPH